MKPLGLLCLGFLIGYSLAQFVCWSLEQRKTNQKDISVMRFDSDALFARYTSSNETAPVESTTVNSTLSTSRKVRVLCWVMTSPTNHQKKAKYTKQTWGKRCDIFLLMSTKEDQELGTVVLSVEEGRKNLWLKTREAYKYVYNHYLNDADWFLKADDDTYVIVENLRYLVSSHSPDSPVYFGFKYDHYIKQGYMAGGSGYVLSREAVRRFVEVGLTRNGTCEKYKFAEDVWIGKCLEDVEVIAGDSRDEKGRERFSALTLDRLWYPENAEKWFRDYAFYPLKGEKECCSDYLISVHYINPSNMVIYDYLIYSVKIHG